MHNFGSAALWLEGLRRGGARKVTSGISPIKVRAEGRRPGADDTCWRWLTALAWGAFWVAYPLSSGAHVRAAEAGRVLASWEFDRDGDAQGWAPNAHLAGFTVTNGVASMRGAGPDPILELRAALDVPASPWQVLEVRVKADAPGQAEFFWSRTAEGRYGGFTQEKSTRFQMLGDGQWHTYRVLPGWHPEGRIARLRFDLYDGGRFELDGLRVIELPHQPDAQATGEEALIRSGGVGWQAVTGIELEPGADALGFRVREREAWLLGPPVEVPAGTQSWVSFRLALGGGLHGSVVFATQDRAHLHAAPFRIRGDGQPHFYNLDLLANPDWRGRVILLGFRFDDAVGAQGTLSECQVSDRPQGPPQLDLASVALADAVARVGRPVRLSARVTNSGGEPARSVQATLELPADVEGEVVAAEPEPGSRRTLAPEAEALWEWTLRARRAGTGDVVVRVTAAGGESSTARATWRVAPALAGTVHGYVPEPRPVRGPFEVGVYYFPGWKTASQWHPIQGFAERRPALGWYREGDPEVADWHIKWAVEHGITFFAYDWYWSRGTRQLEHALHEGFFQARYRHLLKFCLLWANHNPPGSSSLEDARAVARFWIEHYFRRPEYLTTGGRPLVVIFSPDRLTNDLGSPGVRRALDAMREECRRAGLPEVFLAACVGEPGQARLAGEEGYDAVTAYTWPGLGLGPATRYAPYADLLEGYRGQWRRMIEVGPLPLIPPVCGGWDSRPWHGENNLVRFGRTPEIFRQHLADTRRLLESHAADGRALPLALIEAWNEWGEGSYIEPHAEFGFGYLDAVRAVFAAAPAAHEDLVPADVGRGLNEVAPLRAERPEWTFARGLEGWEQVMDLTDLAATNGVWQARSVGADAAVFGPPMQASAREHGTLRLRLRLTRTSGGLPPDDTAQLFWRTTRLPEGEANSVRFPVRLDGEWHDYEVVVGTNPRWRGVITRLRLDPCNHAGVRVEWAGGRLEP